jgi:hypothetical protein
MGKILTGKVSKIKYTKNEIDEILNEILYPRVKPQIAIELNAETNVSTYQLPDNINYKDVVLVMINGLLERKSNYLIDTETNTLEFLFDKKLKDTDKIQIEYYIKTVKEWTLHRHIQLDCNGVQITYSLPIEVDLTQPIEIWYNGLHEKEGDNYIIDYEDRVLKFINNFKPTAVDDVQLICLFKPEYNAPRKAASYKLHQFTTDGLTNEFIFPQNANLLKYLTIWLNGLFQTKFSDYYLNTNYASIKYLGHEYALKKSDSLITKYITL